MFAGLAMLDGYIYAVGGWEGSARLDSIERYNPNTNLWSFVAPMKMEVTSPAVVAHDGMLFVTGMVDLLETSTIYNVVRVGCNLCLHFTLVYEGV